MPYARPGTGLRVHVRGVDGTNEPLRRVATCTGSVVRDPPVGTGTLLGHDDRGGLLRVKGAVALVRADLGRRWLTTVRLFQWVMTQTATFTPNA
jgi:hypothetical protein